MKKINFHCQNKNCTVYHTFNRPYLSNIYKHRYQTVAHQNLLCCVHTCDVLNDCDCDYFVLMNRYSLKIHTVLYPSLRLQSTIFMQKNLNDIARYSL